MKVRIAITMGDPAGIGPEIILKAIPKFLQLKKTHPFIIGDLNILKKNISKLRLNKNTLSNISIIDLKNVDAQKLKNGVVSKQCGKASGEYILHAITGIKNNEFDAMVTGPINKKSFELSGWGKRYRGHTEMIRDLTQSPNAAILMLHNHFRSIQVTSHIPLRQVSSRISIENILRTIELGNDFLKRLGIKKPHIAVSGLNPHAGDEGLMGLEEIKIIAPAVKLAAKKGIHVKGPISPDIIWPLVYTRKFDLGVAMYHDQAQIPIKLLGFQKNMNSHMDIAGVNVTVGPPIIRTSVDHGTGFDIAGKGIASPHSLIDAYVMAFQLCQNRKR